GQVAAVAAELDEEPLAAADHLRAGERLHVGMTLDAVRLHFLPAVERGLDELDVLEVAGGVVVVAVRLAVAVDRRPLPAVAGRAAELVDGVLAEQQLAVGMGLPRIRLVLEAGLVDGCMTAHAAVDARDRLVEVVPVELGEHDLLNLGDLRLPVPAEEGKRGLRPGVVAERDALELLLEVVARRGGLRGRRCAPGRHRRPAAARRAVVLSPRSRAARRRSARPGGAPRRSGSA